MRMTYSKTSNLRTLIFLLQVILVFWAVFSFFGGCSNYNQNIVYQDKGKTSSFFTADSCAIGGIVLRDSFQLDHLAGVDFAAEVFTHEVQSDLWGQLLDTAFVANAKKKPAVGWFEWRNTISQEILAQTLDCQARHALVPPETLLECGKYFPQARWLFLVSIYRMRFIVDNIYGVEPQHAYARNIWMKFNVYDLKQGCSIWESNVVYKGKRQAEPTGSSQSIKRWQTVDEGELPTNVMTKVLSGPPLRPTLDEGLIALLNPIFTTGPDPDEEEPWDH